MIEHYFNDERYPLVIRRLWKNISVEFREKEHIFLSGENYWKVQEMMNLKSTKVLNPKTGKEDIKKRFLLGINKAKISKVSLKKTKQDALYIKVEFTRKGAVVRGTRLSFAPYADMFFNIQDEKSEGFAKVRDLLIELGSDLKPIPEGYSVESYIKHVARRIRDHSIVSVDLGINIKKALVRDDYGDIELRRSFDGANWKDRPVVAYKEVTAFYGNKKYDWSKSVAPLSKQDQDELLKF